MNELRRILREIKSILKKVPFLQSLPSLGKYIFAIGGIAWIIGGLIPDTAHFAVTFFCSIGRIVVFIGLFFTLVEGEEDRSIMIISAIISAGALIIIIVELATIIYFASFESYIYLIFFGALAVNSSKYLKNKQWFDDQKKDAHLNVFTDILSQSMGESESPIQIEPLPRKAPPTQPEASAQPFSSHTQSEAPPEEAPSASPESTPRAQSETMPETAPSAPPKASALQSEAPKSPTQTTNRKSLKIKRAPSVRSAPSVSRAPRVRLKPKK